jgi:glutamate-ammonia-ligase adenylyltransferase
VDAALTYYENLGRDWERQALIRMRHVAGPAAPAERFIGELQPFVYRRSLEPITLRAIHEMKLRIESERRQAGREVENDIKEGPGGIRDVEFLTQALQLFHGGRHPELRTGNVLDALDAMEQQHILPAPVSDSLRSAYLWLRRAEHAVQMLEERQTQRFPGDETGQLGLARRMGYSEAEGKRARARLLQDWDRVREEMRQHFDALVIETRFESRTRSDRSLDERLAEPLRGTPLFARLSTIAAPFLERRANDPHMNRIDGAPLRGLARAITSGAEVARYLSARPSVVETLADADESTLRQRADWLATAPAPARPDDLEAFLDALRLTVRDERALAACLHLAGLAPFQEVSRHLSIVAEACVRWALEAAPQAGPPVSVVGMGKIAGREFTYHSDLDLLFLYSDPDADPVGPSRTAQRLIHYLATNTGAGAAYSVDSRLRPSGRQGLLVTTFDAFRRYQLETAATWEHLALMRSRVIAGEVEAAQAVLDETRAAVVAGAASPWAAIAQIRGRVERERVDATRGVLEFKTGAGGTMEVDFLAAGALLERRTAPAPGQLPSVPVMLGATLPAAGAADLSEAYAELRLIEACTRWVAGRGVETLRLASESAPLVAELLEPGCDVETLAQRVRDARRRVRRAYERVLDAGTVGVLGG